MPRLRAKPKPPVCQWCRARFQRHPEVKRYFAGYGLLPHGRHRGAATAEEKARAA